MAKDLLLPGSILSLHRSAVEKLLKAGNGDAALLYLCLTAGQNSGALPWGPDQVEAAQNPLLRLGLISSDTPVQPPRPEKLEDDRPPDYTTQDIAQAFQNDGGFKALVPAVEQMLGKVLSPSDLKILYTLYDFLALPPEVLLTLTGWCVEQAKAIVLAMGCRERTRGAIAIPGTRPAGVFTAGAAQRYVNVEGYLPGKRVVILGSGDIGLIMARRMTLEGAKVLACVEVMPYSGGLNRNIVQCLQDFDIPLYLSHTVTEIRGKNRVEQVVVSQVGPDRKPVPGTEMVFDCDTLLLSVGLLPENELTQQAGIRIDPRTKGAVVYENMETSLPGVFACGNVCHVHDLVDFVTAESQRAGAAAADYVLSGGQAEGRVIEVQNGSGVTYTVPQHIRPSQVDKSCGLFFRVNRICGDSEILVTSGDQTIARFKREHLAPGEMENITLPKVLLDKAGDTLTVSIREVD